MTSSHFKGGSKSECPTFHGSCDSYDKLETAFSLFLRSTSNSFTLFQVQQTAVEKNQGTSRHPLSRQVKASSAVRSVCFQSAPDLMDIFFWCSLTSVIVLSPSTNLKVGLRILSMSPCVYVAKFCDDTWMHTMIWCQKGHFRLGEILPSDSEFCVSMDCTLCD